MNDLLIIDGNSLLATSFYGTVPKKYFNIDKTNPKEVEEALINIDKDINGINLNAVYIFFNILGKAIRSKNFQNLVITWDKSRDTFRREIYNEYKKNRSVADYAMVEQKELIQELLKSANITSLENERYEADDIIGSLCNRFKNKYNIYIMSKDQDLLQLLDDNVYLWLKTKEANNMNKQRNKNNILNGYFEFNISDLEYYYKLKKPEYIIDFISLVGDQADNIPGVKGIGEKTAIPLINHFENIENMYMYLENEDKKNIIKLMKEDLDIKINPYNKLVKNKEFAFLSKRLARIKIDIEDVSKLEENDIKLIIDSDTFLKKCKSKNIIIKP